MQKSINSYLIEEEKEEELAAFQFISCNFSWITLKSKKKKSKSS